MKHCYLSTGSNLGNRNQYLESAKLAVIQRIGQLSAASAVYETSPWGLTNQPAFLNQVLDVCTNLSATEILAHCQAIELELGRQRNEFWGARTIDIDILAIDDLVMDSENLKIPHPWMTQRRFVLVPLCELAPDWQHPILQQTACELLQNCTDKSGLVLELLNC